MSLSSSARLRAAVVLSAAAGGLHLAVVPEHLREGWLTGLFFAVVGTGQVAWAARVAAGPSRPLLVLGAAANAAVVGLWLFSRTAGLPLGPHPWAPEPVGLADLLASAFEAGVVWGALAVAVPGRPRRGGAGGGPPANGGAPRPPLRPLPRWVTVREASLLADASEDVVRGWIRQGRVAVRRLTLGPPELTLVRSDDLLALTPVDLAAWGFDRPAAAGGPRGPRSAPPTLPRAGAWALAALCLFALTGGGLVLTERLVSGGEGSAAVAGPGHGEGHHAGTEAPGTERPAARGHQPERSAEAPSPGPGRPSAQGEAAPGPADPARALLQPVKGRTVAGGPRMPCRRLLRTLQGSCGRVGTAGGRMAWTVERGPHGPVARLYAFSRERGAWVARLRAGGPAQALLRAAVRAADLVGDGRPELVVGFRLRGLDGLSYEVLTFPGGRSPRVALHAWVARGSVNVEDGRISEYYGLSPSDGGQCCSEYLRVVVGWDGSAFRPLSARGPLPAASVPPSDF